MSFDSRDVRRTMDVYTRDNVYLGTVLRVMSAPSPSPRSQGSSSPHEPSVVNGELLGPAPTQTIGNRGPATQSAARGFATMSDGAEPLGPGAITVGRWWGLRGRRVIPLADVQTISMERVVLRLTYDQLGAEG